MKIMLDEGAKMPTRAHPYDAGLDLYAMEEFFVPYNHRVTVDTGVHVEIPEGYVGLIKSKSGLMTKSYITTDGTIDAHYTGSIRVCLFNHSDVFHSHFKTGDKIAQLVIVPCLLPELEQVDTLEETDRGNAGFGSTGR